MTSQFDELAKAVARGTSRRKAIRTFVVSLLGGLTVGALAKNAPVASAADLTLSPRVIPVQPLYQINQFLIPCINQTSIFVINQTLEDCEEFTPTGSEDEKDEKPKPTSQEQRQNERTNKGSKDDERVEGNVIALDLGSQPPTMTIANRDGNVVVVLSGDALKAAQYIKVGNYVTATGEKQHELLFWADDLSKD